MPALSHAKTRAQLSDFLGCFSLFVVLVVVDSALTYYFIGLRSVLPEINPIWKHALQQGPIFFFAAKISLAIVGYLFLKNINTANRTLPLCANLAYGGLLMIWVVALARA